VKICRTGAEDKEEAEDGGVEERRPRGVIIALPS